MRKLERLQYWLELILATLFFIFVVLPFGFIIWLERVTRKDKTL